MRPFEQMDEEERQEFYAYALQLMSEVMGGNPVNDYIAAVRPATLAMWIKGHNRPVRNVWVEYDVDRAAFIDDCVREGAQFMSNLLAALNHKPPPPHVIKPRDLATMKQITTAVRSMLQLAGYRPVLHAVLENFFEDQRREGNL